MIVSVVILKVVSVIICRCLQFAMFGVSGAAGPGWIVIWLLLEIFPTVEIFLKSTCCNKEG